jgi:hypothetical protein
VTWRCAPALLLAFAQVGAQQGAASATRADTLAAARAAVKTAGPSLTGYYAVPDIPAATMLDVSSSKVARPGSMKDLAVGLLNGIGADGRPKQGFAMEASSSLLRIFRVTLDQYQTSAVARMKARLAFSLAAVQSAGDSASTDIGWGVRLPLWDDGDVLADSAYTRALGSDLLSCAPAKPPADIPANAGQSADELRRGADSAAAARRAADSTAHARQIACMHRLSTVKALTDDASALGRQAAADRWNVRRASLGYAASARIPRHAVSNYQYAADRLWLALAVPLERAVQGVGYADVTHHHAFDTLAAFTSVAAGARVNVGSARANAFAELLGEAISGPASPKRSSAWSAGVEFLATEGVWISTGIGKRARDALQPEHTVVIANVRWGFAGKSFLDPTGR